MSVITGIDFNSNDQKAEKTSLTTEKRVEIFYTTLGGIFFPTIVKQEKFDGWPKQLYRLIIKLKTDFMQGLKDPQKMKVALKDIIYILADLKIIKKPLIEALLGLLNEDLSSCEPLLQSFLPPTIPPEVPAAMVQYLTDALDLLGLHFSTASKPAILSSTQPESKNGIDPEDWNSILKKIKEGTASAVDLFKMIDAEGDKSGAISREEFEGLAKRLGLKLSSHRIKEIFAEIKGEKVQTGSDELNQDEFAKALDYLQKKNVNQALQLLGLTPEILTAVLIRLVILLVLIFVFIFLGIKAFAIGGTFGSIINSLFPAAGGGALGKEKDSDKDKLEGENVKNAAVKGFDITTSEQL